MSMFEIDFHLFEEAEATTFSTTASDVVESAAIPERHEDTTEYEGSVNTAIAATPGKLRYRCYYEGSYMHPLPSSPCCLHSQSMPLCS